MNWLGGSKTYQAILARGEALGEVRGKIAEARRLILIVGTAKFGPLDQATARVLLDLDALDQLERVYLRILRADAWTDLLASEPDR